MIVRYLLLGERDQWRVKYLVSLSCWALGPIGHQRRKDRSRRSLSRINASQRIQVLSRWCYLAPIFFTVQWAIHHVFTQQVDDRLGNLLPPIRYLQYVVNDYRYVWSFINESSAFIFQRHSDASLRARLVSSSLIVDLIKWFVDCLASSRTQFPMFLYRFTNFSMEGLFDFGNEVITWPRWNHMIPVNIWIPAAMTFVTGSIAGARFQLTGRVIVLFASILHSIQLVVCWTALVDLEAFSEHIEVAVSASKTH